MPLLFLNLGGGEVLMIFLIVVIFFGPKKIPELARVLGKGIRQVKDATNDIKQEIKDSAKDSEVVSDLQNQVKSVKDTMNDVKEVVKDNPISDFKHHIEDINVIKRKS